MLYLSHANANASLWQRQSRGRHQYRRRHLLISGTMRSETYINLVIISGHHVTVMTSRDTVVPVLSLPTWDLARQVNRCASSHSQYHVMYCKATDTLNSNAVVLCSIQKSFLWCYATSHQESLFYLMTPIEHINFHINGYWTSSIWSLCHISLKETRCRHIGYSFWSAARDLLYALFHRHNSTYHILWWTSCGPGWNRK